MGFPGRDRLLSDGSFDILIREIKRVYLPQVLIHIPAFITWTVNIYDAIHKLMGTMLNSDFLTHRARLILAWIKGNVARTFSVKPIY